MKPETIELSDTRHVGVLRNRLREWSRELGFRTVRATKLITAASELGRNVVVHAGGGRAELSKAEGDRGQVGIRMRFVDQGPGIPDIAAAMVDGYTTGGGMGLGLSGAQRLLGELEIDTGPTGTVIEVVAWKR